MLYIEGKSFTGFKESGIYHVCETGNPELRFKTDNTVVYDGFELSWKCATGKFRRIVNLNKHSKHKLKHNTI